MFLKKKIYIIGIIISILLLLGCGVTFLLPQSGMGRGAGMMSGDFNPENIPEDFDINSLKENFNPENMPEGFSTGNMDFESMRSNMEIVQTIRIVVIVIALVALIVCIVMLLRVSKRHATINNENEQNSEQNNEQNNEQR